MPRICTAWAMATRVFGAWLTPEGAFPVVMLASFLRGVPICETIPG